MVAEMKAEPYRRERPFISGRYGLAELSDTHPVHETLGISRALRFVASAPTQIGLGGLVSGCSTVEKDVSLLLKEAALRGQWVAIETPMYPHQFQDVHDRINDSPSNLADPAYRAQNFLPEGDVPLERQLELAFRNPISSYARGAGRAQMAGQVHLVEDGGKVYMFLTKDFLEAMRPKLN